MNREAIEGELRAMTEWEGESGRVWERALEAAEGESAGAGAHEIRRARPWHARRWAGLALAAAAVLVISVGVFAPTLSRVRSAAPGTPAEAGVMLGKELERVGPAQDKDFGGYKMSPELRRGSENVAGWALQEAGQRAVVRKATMEITAGDVRAAALKARQLLSEPRGEYVESSDIDDSDAEHPRADLVLRVEASRLEEVLTALRELGKVESERVDGEDVTEQMVDVGARLENERRIEKELAELLEKRPDDKLEDILAVRRELGSVRERIEQLAAQQENLSRMVRLARVAVMLRTEPGEAEPLKGVWSTFVENLAGAWGDGIAMLLGTVSGLVRVVVGGAIWFAIAGVVAALAWRKWRAERPRRLEV